MPKYPDALWRPLSTNPSIEGPCEPEIGCLHTMVGSLWGTDAYFMKEGYGGTESHFGVGYDGQVIQWQDTLYQADANLNGNDRVISIETADKGPGFPAWTGSNVPAWTNAQVNAIARLLVWLNKVHGIPLVLIPNTAESSEGIGYHRQGIDPWRCSTCERWSTAYGKVCPGDRRVNQIPGIIKLANDIISAPAPKPPIGGNEMTWMAQKGNSVGIVFQGDRALSISITEANKIKDQSKAQGAPIPLITGLSPEAIKIFQDNLVAEGQTDAETP